MNTLDNQFLNDFLNAYIEAALWSSTDENDEPLDQNYGMNDLIDSTREEAELDCKNFINENKATLKTLDYKNSQYSNAELLGHDFWLTRNGHGAGFWDRGLGAMGDKLTASCKAYGSMDIYTGDDGFLYFS